MTSVHVNIYLHPPGNPPCSEEVDELAKRLKLKLFRTSVKENFNVDQGNATI